MPRKRNSLKHDLFIAASKNITNNRTRTSYKRAITRFTKWAKEHNIKKKSDITEEVIQLYQLDLNDDPKQYSVATIHTYLAPVCKAVDINMNRVRKDKRSSDKIIRGRVKSKNSQGKHQETDSRFSRLVNFQRAVGIRRSELKKLKGKDILVIDAGQEFAGDNMPGVDYIIPDVSYLIAKKKQIKGIIITHGHLDHIGALKVILSSLDYPTIYTSPLTLGMIKRSLDEKDLKNLKYKLIDPDIEILKLGVFTIEFFRVNHSIPEAMGLSIHTPKGMIVFSGDFKVDFTPSIDRPADLGKISRIGQEGVRLYL